LLKLDAAAEDTGEYPQHLASVCLAMLFPLLDETVEMLGQFL
jgi:hypothetical protein